MEDMIDDIIIDIIVDGRVLSPKEIPSTVSAEIEALVAQGAEPREVVHDGVSYWWFVRPCVYP